MDNVHKFDGIYHIATAPSTMGYVMVFPAEKLQILRNNILADKWFIPVKLDEPLGLCLQSAILIVEQGQFNESVECQQFIDTIVPEAFRKVKIAASIREELLVHDCPATHKNVDEHLVVFLVTNDSIGLYMAKWNSQWNLRYARTPGWLNQCSPAFSTCSDSIVERTRYSSCLSHRCSLWSPSLL